MLASRKRRWATVGLLVAVSLTWEMVAVTHLFGIWVWSHLGHWTRGAYGLAWLVAATVTALVAVRLGRTRRFVGAGMVVALSAVSALTIAQIDWTRPFAYGYYRIHRSDFLAVAALARTGQLDPTGHPAAELQHLAVNGDPFTLGSHAVFVPTWTGPAGGPTGYAYGLPADADMDCRSRWNVRCWTLGDGWSWMEIVAIPQTAP
ncbi:hypothetical protein KRM28CT15_10310 [Krasilnikovia sp. M28-CT-15]